MRRSLRKFDIFERFDSENGTLPNKVYMIRGKDDGLCLTACDGEIVMREKMDGPRVEVNGVFNVTSYDNETNQFVLINVEVGSIVFINTNNCFIDFDENGVAILSNRMKYRFNFTGGNIVVDSNSTEFEYLGYGKDGKVRCVPQSEKNSYNISFEIEDVSDISNKLVGMSLVDVVNDSVGDENAKLIEKINKYESNWFVRWFLKD